MYAIVNEIRRFADEDSETIGRDILRRKLHVFADRVTETCDAITKTWKRKFERQAASMAATAAENVKLRNRLFQDSPAHPSCSSAATPKEYAPEK